MPFKPKKPCPYSGCPNLTDGGKCEEHRRKIEREYEKERGSASERGYDATWHKVSEMHLNEFPLCAECEKQSRATAATMTHHIKRIVDGGDKLAWDNLESLCEACHNEKHKGGRWGR